MSAGAGSIVWLVSYPKSGSTWLRAMLTALVHPDRPLDLARLVGAPAQELRETLDEACGIASADLREEELPRYRASLHRRMSAEARGPLFAKTHERHPRGPSPYPDDAAAAIIHIVRDPRHVAASLAHHLATGVDAAIARMADPEAALDSWPRRITDHLPIRMGSWSEHARSWLDRPGMAPLTIRYEDMLADPAGTLGAAARHAGLDASPARCAEAAAAADLSRLAALERQAGFPEAPRGLGDFFRRGPAGGARAALTPDQEARVGADHGPMMRRLGYPALAARRAMR